MTGRASLVVRETVRLGNLYRSPVAAGTIPFDLVMLLVAALTGRNAVGKGERHRCDMAAETGKLMPVVGEADGAGAGRPPRRGH